MHGLDVGADVWHEFQPGRRYRGQLTGREGCSPTVVDVTTVRRRRGELVPVERGVGPAMTDHVCAWAAASPARYRASSSAMAASKSSRSNTTIAAI